jgi:hypothetical protein
MDVSGPCRNRHQRQICSQSAGWIDRHCKNISHEETISLSRKEHFGQVPQSRGTRGLLVRENVKPIRRAFEPLLCAVYQLLFARIRPHGAAPFLLRCWKVVLCQIPFCIWFLPYPHDVSELEAGMFTLEQGR